MQLTAEWREYGARDTVQMKWLLWHTWHSLAKLKIILAKPVVDTETKDEITSRKNRKSQTINARDDRALRRHKYLIAKGKITAKEYTETHVYRCPHIACLNSRRPFTAISVFDHL